MMRGHLSTVGQAKGQAAIMDALFFMLICSGSATLLFYVASLYGSSTDEQLTSVYNQEFASSALVGLHYVTDMNGDNFWNKVRDSLSLANHNSLDNYLNGAGTNVWANLTLASPSRDTFLCFSALGSADYCYKDDAREKSIKGLNITAYTSSVNMLDSASNTWSVTLKLYY